ncbi:MAG: OmpA family protein [Buchnera aphidicola (Pentalonia nigronervosa)]|uniref:Outer membrane protein A n=1 Tax=Buchnera aphidicola (Pentalonia nigronervosa) TaxID=1309793 RepID=A0A7H1AZV7_9GAMM|nr:MAG: OmpA family protein [Buchnera aphidicola (Pentalonia nigronervosa)]
MKKIAFSITLLLASCVCFGQEVEKNPWYLGLSTGLSRFDLSENNIHNSNNMKYTFFTRDSMEPSFSTFLGYEFNPYFSAELENNFSGYFSHLFLKKNTNKKSMQSNSVQLLTKLSYPITHSLHVYTRLGGALFLDNLVSKNNKITFLNVKQSLFPSASLGVEYVFKDRFITRLDYNLKSNIKNMSDISVKPTIQGDATLSFGWKFGGPNRDNFPVFHSHELLKQQYVTLNENINFPFDSTALKYNAYDKLEKLDKNIKKMNLKNISVVLLGYTDRIGTVKYNKKLSEKRANTIKNYLTSRGILKKDVTVQGLGKTHPLTEKICKNIKNKSLLISCLSPDRRVEIKVLSYK